MKESKTIQLCIRNKLDKMKLKDYEDSNTFFIDFEKTINDLRAACANIDEQEKLYYVMKTLPESLYYVGDLIDVLKDENRNCEFLKRKISMWETKEN